MSDMWSMMHMSNNQRNTFAGMKVGIDVDSREVQELLERLKSAMTPAQFNRAMYGVMDRTAKHVKVIVGKDVPKKYRVKATDARNVVRAPKITTSGTGVGAVIPLEGKRLILGRGYKAFGGAQGWPVSRAKRGRSKKRKGTKKITAHIVKSGTSVLPKNLPPNYGGNPPFINIGAKKIGGLVMTRETEKQRPIRVVAGVSIPQMPMNLAEPEVQKDIADYLQVRIEQRLRALIENGR